MSKDLLALPCPTASRICRRVWRRSQSQGCPRLPAAVEAGTITTEAEIDGAGWP